MIGAPIAARSPVRTVQLIVAGALLMAALFYSLSNLGLMPVGGDAASLPVPLTIIAVAASFVFGVLLNFGVGNYAPTLAMLSLLGMDPRLAFPIMAFGAALAGAAASSRLVKLADLDLRIVLSLAVGSIPGGADRGLHRQGNAADHASLAGRRGRHLCRHLAAATPRCARPPPAPEELLEQALVD